MIKVIEKEHTLNFRLLIICFLGISGCKSVTVNQITQTSIYKKLVLVDDLLQVEAECHINPDNSFLLNLWTLEKEKYQLHGQYVKQGNGLFFEFADCIDSLVVKSDHLNLPKDSIRISLNFKLPDDVVLNDSWKLDTNTFGTLSYKLGTEKWVPLSSNKGPWFVPTKGVHDTIQFRYSYRKSLSNLSLTQKTFYSKQYHTSSSAENSFDIEWILFQYSCRDDLEIVGLIDSDESKLQLYFKTLPHYSGIYNKTGSVSK